MAAIRLKKGVFILVTRWDFRKSYFAEILKLWDAHAVRVSISFAFFRHGICKETGNILYSI